MMLRSLLCFILSQCLLHGAEISWSPPQDITGSLSDFDTIGDPVYQWNAGSTTVTIDPNGMNLSFSPGALFDGTVFSDVDPYNRGGISGYENLLAEMTYTTSTASINLTGLTPGHRYRLQLWMADTRSCCQGRLKTYDSGNGSQQVVLNSGPPSQFVIGTFTAEASTQEIRFVGSGASHPQYNALAVRTLGPPTPVVELFKASDGTFNSPSGINVASGTAVTLTWNISEADAVVIDQNIGSVSNTGQTTVAPTTTTTYTVSGTNAHGTSQQSVTVYVGAAVTAPRINEMVTKNDVSLRDEDGDPSDWIELYNPNPFVIDASSYRLTDDSSLTASWQIPAGTVIPANGYLVLFASGKNRTGAELHTDFKLNADGEYLALTDIAGSSVLSQLPENYPTELLFPALPVDRSYGYNSNDQLRFFSTPTPGEANGEGFLGFVGDTAFSHDRGFYESPINLIITTATPGATIRYTTDGSPPTESHGSIYSGPISIGQTTAIRAFAYKAGFAATNIDTHTYIYASDVIASSVMDTGITQNGTYGPEMINSLKALPIISLNIENPDGVDNGTENLTSIELIYPDGSKGFQEDAGIGYFGGYFTDFAKKSFRLKFRKAYGVGKLNFPLYRGFANGIAPAEKFDAIDLRSGSHDMAMRGAYMSNRFTDDTMLEMGNISPHGRFVHLFRNGVYWGQYHLRERWSAAMAEEYFGGEKEDYEAINGNANVGGWSPGVAYDGDGSGWQTIKTLAAGGTPWASLQSRLDMQSYIDFWLLYDFGSSENEYRAFGQPIENGVKMKFYLNDADGWTHPTGIAQNNDTGGPGNIMGRLESENHVDFKTYFADRIYAHYFNDGALAAHKNIARLQRRIDETQLSFYCEAARWGYRSPSSWQNYQNNLLNTQFPAQTASRLNDLRNAGRYPNVEAPEFNQNGGVVGPEFGVYISSLSGGTIHYTIDGTDPRLPGGAVNPSAVSLTGGSDSSTLLAAGSAWKYLDDGSNQGTAWYGTSFNDSSWSIGNAQLGYGDGDETSTVSYGSNSNNKHITTYFRKTFDVADSAALLGLTLELVRDDGAVVYINGQEALRSNMPAGNVSSNTVASSAVGGQDESAFFQFNVSPSFLVTGTNTIAVEIHQRSQSSTDISFDLRITATTGASTPDLQLSSDTTIMARVLKNGTWSALHPADFIVSQPPLAPQVGDLAISEIHYHPSNPTAAELASIPGLDDGDFEFLELMNISAHPLRLDGCRFIEGVVYDFPEDSILQPNARLVLVSNAAAFALRSGTIPHGEYSGGLKNSGERIAVENASNQLILDLTYGDGTNDLHWPSKPDGNGKSLVLIHPAFGDDPNNPLLWRSSVNDHGTPGSRDSITLPVSLNQDLDGDGSSALLELTLNSSDNDASSLPLTGVARTLMTDSNTYLIINFTRNTLMPARTSVQTSSTLTGWNEDAVFLSRQPHGDGTETLSYRFPAPVNGSSQFMRVKVQH